MSSKAKSGIPLTTSFSADNMPPAKKLSKTQKAKEKIKKSMQAQKLRKQETERKMEEQFAALSLETKEATERQPEPEEVLTVSAEQYNTIKAKFRRVIGTSAGGSGPITKESLSAAQRAELAQIVREQRLGTVPHSPGQALAQGSVKKGLRSTAPTRPHRIKEEPLAEVVERTDSKTSAITVRSVLNTLTKTEGKPIVRTDARDLFTTVTNLRVPVRRRLSDYYHQNGVNHGDPVLKQIRPYSDGGCRDLWLSRHQLWPKNPTRGALMSIGNIKYEHMAETLRSQERLPKLEPSDRQKLADLTKTERVRLPRAEPAPENCIFNRMGKPARSHALNHEIIEWYLLRQPYLKDPKITRANFSYRKALLQLRSTGWIVWSNAYEEKFLRLSGSSHGEARKDLIKRAQDLYSRQSAIPWGSGSPRKVRKKDGSSSEDTIDTGSASRAASYSSSYRCVRPSMLRMAWTPMDVDDAQIEVDWTSENSRDAQMGA